MIHADKEKTEMNGTIQEITRELLNIIKSFRLFVGEIDNTKSADRTIDEIIRISRMSREQLKKEAYEIITKRPENVEHLATMAAMAGDNEVLETISRVVEYFKNEGKA